VVEGLRVQHRQLHRRQEVARRLRPGRRARGQLRDPRREQLGEVVQRDLRRRALGDRREAAHEVVGGHEGVVAEGAINTPFCPLQEKFHTFVLRGLRNISEAP
jgi:hypothetical protein